MPENPPADTPRISAYLLYRDVAGAIDWLTKAFGLRERMRIPGADGAVSHAELEFAAGLVLMGCPGSDYRNPRDLGGVTQSLCVYVDDVDEHDARARAAGAKILQEPADEFYGDRRYGAEDPEGHHWYFATHVRDVAPEDMTPNRG